MNYAAARDRIRSGDVLAFSHRPLRSFYDLQIAIVRGFTRSEYSHVATAWVIGGRVFALEAVGSGVRIFPLSMSGDFYLIPRGVWTAESEARALAEVGKPYSKWDALMSFFGKSDATDGRWFCSEYVAAMLGISLPRPTPAELVRYLLEYEGRELMAVKAV